MAIRCCSSPAPITWGNALLRDGSVLGTKMSQQAHTIGQNGFGLGVVGFDPDGACEGTGYPPGTTFSALGHAGGIPGANSMLFYDTATDTTAVVLTNRFPVDGLEQLVADQLALVAAAQQ